jgi:DNA polymerase-3 subunit alpha
VQIDVPEWSDALRLCRRARDAGSVPDGASDHRVRARARSGHQWPHRRRRRRPPVGAGENGWRGPGKSVTLAVSCSRSAAAADARASLDDRSGRIEVTLFDDVFQQYRALIAHDSILVVDGALRWDDFIEDWRLAAKRILDVDQAREQYARRLVIRWPREQQQGGARFVNVLEQTLRPYCRGRCSVAVRCSNMMGSAPWRNCQGGASSPRARRARTSWSADAMTAMMAGHGQ